VLFRSSTLIRELAGETKAFSNTRKHNKLPAPVVDVETQLAAEYRGKPLPPLSAELRAKLGAGIPEIAE
jgi:hypothetical protein